MAMNILPFLSAGLLFGLSGGLAPGPLLALVAHETLRHGVRAGIAVALAPLLTDAPIILATLWLLKSLAEQNVALAILSLSGGSYLLWLGLDGLRFQGADLAPNSPAGSLRRGVMANFLNPNPWLFWLTVGAPTIVEAWQGAGGVAVGAFVATFYILLVGFKITLALVLGKGRRILRDKGYIILMRGLGLLLLVYALLFLSEGGWRLLAAFASPG
ncbi:MAG: LysE family transporter [Candidatus Competibacteraceae bacterium]|nr:LysE family transporter [Candidatus Competibacteraceae bacterium]HRY15737.1 LysE family transporter [Candidatus Competibacteraceae bacterium]